MWASDEQKCVIHAKNIKIPGNAVCGYHVPGKPLNSLVDFDNHNSIQSLDPKTSGLEYDIPEHGTMCGNCRYYKSSKSNPENGFCAAVTNQNDNEPLYRAKVEYYGCCSRWEEIIR